MLTLNKTTAGVLQKLTNIADELVAVADKNRQYSDAASTKMAEQQVKRDTADAEIVRAERVRGRLLELLD